MALRSINNRRRSSTTWSIDGVTSQGKDRSRRSLAYNLGTIASDYHLAVLSDAVLEVVSLREVGNAGVQNIIDKIVEGKVKKFYSEVCLLEQGFVKGGDQTVGQLIESKAKALGDEISIARFARFAVGDSGE